MPYEVFQRPLVRIQGKPDLAIFRFTKLDEENRVRGGVITDYGKSPREVAVVQTFDDSELVRIFTAPVEVEPGREDDPSAYFNDEVIQRVLAEAEVETDLAVGQTHEWSYVNQHGHNIAVLIRNAGKTAMEPRLN